MTVQLDIKFRQSKDYTHAMLIRDLIETIRQLNAEIKVLDERLTALEP